MCNAFDVFDKHTPRSKYAKRRRNKSHLENLAQTILQQWIGENDFRINRMLCSLFGRLKYTTRSTCNHRDAITHVSGHVIVKKYRCGHQRGSRPHGFGHSYSFRGRHFANEESSDSRRTQIIVIIVIVRVGREIENSRRLYGEKHCKALETYVSPRL